VSSTKGEFIATLKGQSYTFRMGTRALEDLQELLSPPGQVIPLEAIIKDVLQWRLKYVRAFLWAGLRKYHPQITMDDLEGMLDESDEREVQILLSKLGLTTVPDEKDVKELGGGKVANPPEAQARRKRGTGVSSRSKPAVSV
jgi:hypothetical protein